MHSVIIVVIDAHMAEPVDMGPDADKGLDQIVIADSLVFAQRRAGAI